MATTIVNGVIYTNSGVISVINDRVFINNVDVTDKNDKPTEIKVIIDLANSQSDETIKLNVENVKELTVNCPISVLIAECCDIRAKDIKQATVGTGNIVAETIYNAKVETGNITKKN